MSEPQQHLPTPPPGYLLGIDTSRAQGPTLDGRALCAAGVRFAIVKATDGHRDPGHERTWDAHAEAILGAGIMLGAYGVLEPYPSTEAAAQAGHFCDVVQGTSTQLVALDFELGKGRPASDLLRAARTWLDTVEARLGLRPLVYTGGWFWNGLVRMAGTGSADDVKAITVHPLWLADYLDGHHVIDPMSERPRVPAGWPMADIWQTGPHGATLPGTNIAVDVNWFEGSAEELRALALTPPSG